MVFVSPFTSFGERLATQRSEYVPVAQLEEQRTFNPWVGGSRPLGYTKGLTTLLFTSFYVDKKTLLHIGKCATHGDYVSCANRFYRSLTYYAGVAQR